MNMSEEEIKENVKISLNFLESLTKNGWKNINQVYIKSTMGKPYMLYKAHHY